MEPRAGQGQSRLDHRSDLYSLGVLLYDVRPPAPRRFVGGADGDHVAAHQHRPPAAPGKGTPTSRRSWRALIVRPAGQEPQCAGRARAAEVGRHAPRGRPTRAGAGGPATGVFSRRRATGSPPPSLSSGASETANGGFDALALPGGLRLSVSPVAFPTALPSLAAPKQPSPERGLRWARTMIDAVVVEPGHPLARGTIPDRTLPGLLAGRLAPPGGFLRRRPARPR